MIAQLEGQRPDPWALSDAPADFVARRLASLVGLQVTIERLVGKTKASQNQPDENRASVLDALAREQPGSALLRLMRSVIG